MAAICRNLARSSSSPSAGGLAGGDVAASRWPGGAYLAAMRILAAGVVRSLVSSLVLERTSERTTCRSAIPQPGAVCTRRQAEPTDLDVKVRLALVRVAGCVLFARGCRVGRVWKRAGCVHGRLGPDSIGNRRARHTPPLRTP